HWEGIAKLLRTHCSWPPAVDGEGVRPLAPLSGLATTSSVAAVVPGRRYAPARVAGASCCLPVCALAPAASLCGCPRRWGLCPLKEVLRRSPIRSIDEALWLPSSVQPVVWRLPLQCKAIANAWIVHEWIAERLPVRSLWARSADQLFAQAAHVDAYQALVPGSIDAPDVADQLIEGNDPAGVRQQQLHQAKLCRGEPYLLSSQGDRPAVAIQGERAGGQQRRLFTTWQARSRPS